jgi:uncharacterized protein Usg
MVLLNVRPVLLQVVYYRPDYPSLLQEFTIGYDDRVPELIRTHKFLNHWRKNIEAVIAEVMISINGDTNRSWRSVDDILSIN